MVTTGDKLRAFALARLDAAASALDPGAADPHTGIHRARKAIRQTRAALELARKPLAPRAARVSAALGRLCRRFSRIRDAHAAIETLDELVLETEAPEYRRALRAARRALVPHRAETLAQALAADPDWRDARRRLAVLRAAAAGLDWRMVRSDDVRKALRRGRRRVARVAARARASADAALRHRWRRRVRRLRQQLAIVGEILAANTARRPLPLPARERRALARRSDALGREHDLIVLRRLLARASTLPPATRTTLRRFLAAALARSRAATGRR